MPSPRSSASPHAAQETEHLGVARELLVTDVLGRHRFGKRARRSHGHAGRADLDPRPGAARLVGAVSHGVRQRLAKGERRQPVHIDALDADAHGAPSERVEHDAFGPSHHDVDRAGDPLASVRFGLGPGVAENLDAGTPQRLVVRTRTRSARQRRSAEHDLLRAPADRHPSGARESRRHRRARHEPRSRGRRPRHRSSRFP